MATIRHFVRASGHSPAVLKPTTARQLGGIVAGIRQQYSVPALEAALAALDAHAQDANLPHGTAGITGRKDGFLSAFYRAYLAITTDSPVLSISQFQTQHYQHGATLLEFMRRLVLNELQYVEGYGSVSIPDAYTLPATVNEPGALHPCWSLSATLDYHAAGAVTPNSATGDYYYQAQPLAVSASPYPLLTVVGRVNLYQINLVDQPILQLSNGADILTLFKKQRFGDVLSAELISDTSTLEDAGNILVSLLEGFGGGGNPGGFSDFPVIDNVLHPDIVTRITQYLLEPISANTTATRQAVVETSYGTRDSGLITPTVHTTTPVPILSHRPTSASLGQDGQFAVTVDRESVSMYYLQDGALNRITSPAYGIANPFTELRIGLPVGRYPNGDGIYDLRLFAQTLSPVDISNVMTSFLL